MSANGSDIEDEVVCLLFLRALPDEYNVFRQMLEREREQLTIDWLRTELRARYDVLKEGKQSKTSDTAFLASGTKRGNVAGKNAEISAVINKKTGGLRGKIVMARTVAAARVVATDFRPGSKVDPHAATSARRRGTSNSRAPSGRSVVSAARLATIPIPALRL